MNTNRTWHPVVLLAVCLAMLASSVTGTVLASAPQAGRPFADPAFANLWARTDALVAGGKIKRSFYWGVQPNTDGIYEDFAEGPNGKHLVQYFDKGRMEINNPNGDKNSPFYVTTGLLTLEMISGFIQTGAGAQQDHWRAEIPVAGDTDDPTAPTYASLRNHYISWDNPRPLGQVMTDTIDRAGTEGAAGYYARYNVKVAKAVNFDERVPYNVPNVFWQFLNASGPVLINGKQTTARLSDPWFYVTGRPATRAYWTSVKVAGKQTDVLFQAYERRVLTYVPSAPAGWQVQMGNIGLHYYDWRYNGAGKPASAFCATPPVGGFRSLWISNLEVQKNVGCPGVRYGISSIFAVQHFEHGYMLSHTLRSIGSHSETRVDKWIYVFYDDGTARQYPDGYDPSVSQPTPETAPQGLVTPVLGFGKLWREQPGVRARLGWATAPEFTPADSDWAVFEYGIMVYTGAQDDKVFVLYNHSGLSGVINSWAVFEGAYRQ